MMARAALAFTAASIAYPAHNAKAEAVMKPELAECFWKADGGATAQYIAAAEANSSRQPPAVTTLIGRYGHHCRGLLPAHSTHGDVANVLATGATTSHRKSVLQRYRKKGIRNSPLPEAPTPTTTDIKIATCVREAEPSVSAQYAHATVDSYDESLALYDLGGALVDCVSRSKYIYQIHRLTLKAALNGAGREN